MAKKIGIIIVGIIVALFLFKNFIIKTGIEIGAGQVLGFKTKVGSVKFSPFAGAITIKDIKIKNPKEFTEDLFCHVSLVELNLNVSALVLSQQVLIDKISLHLEQFTIEKANKVSNISQLKVMQKKDKEEKAPAPAEESKEKVDLKFHINELSLSIQELNYVTDGKKRSLDLDLNKTFKNISSPVQLVSVVVVEVIKAATLGKLPLGDDLLNIQSELTSKALKGITDAKDKLKSELGKVTGALQENETVKEATAKIGGLLDKGTGSLKGLLGGSN